MGRKKTTDKDDKFLKYKKLPDSEIDKIIIQATNSVLNKGGYGDDGWNETNLTYRRAAISNLIGKGLATRRIYEEMMSRWGINRRLAKDWLQDCWKYLGELAEEEVRYTAEILQQKIDIMAEECIAEGDKKTALKAYELIGRMNGQFKDNLKVENKTEVIFSFGGKKEEEEDDAGDDK